ncbi:MAG TPA: hypothetical protein DCX53_14110 [Anaerolineae bacterium]|nr:hypothetical protein [Anaerolineae bacterium]
MLASSNSAGVIDVWDLKSGTLTLVGSIRKETVYSLAFNPSGTQLAVGTSGFVYLIDPKTVKETARIPHAGKVNGVAYSADGSTLATASLKAIQFWAVTTIPKLDSANLVDAACSRLTVNFSESQWSSFFSDEEFRVLCKDLPVPK